MVLTLAAHSLNKPLIQTGKLCLLIAALSACSALQPSEDTNISPERKVIAVSGKVEQQTQQESRQTPEEATAKPSAETTVPPIPAQKKKDVLHTVLEQAIKAIDNQQWLRAQHHLEHAMRIESKHAITYLLYARVYQGLGVHDQARNMLKRALFLSRSDSDVHQQAEALLAEIH